MNSIDLITVLKFVGSHHYDFLVTRPIHVTVSGDVGVLIDGCFVLL